MPETRGSNDDAPDTKVPVTYVPKDGPESCKTLSSIVARLNLGNYNGSYHYGALAYLDNLKHYVLLYRVADKPWSVDNFRLLSPSKDDSLDTIDSDKSIQDLIDKCQGIIPVKKPKPSRKKTQKVAKRKKQSTRRRRRIH